VSRTKVNERIKGVDKLFITEEENPKSNNNNESEIVIESKPKTDPIIISESEIESNNKSESNPNHSTINNPTSNPNYEKVKYTDSRVQRAFYYDKKLIKIFDKNYPTSKFNKSNIMNDLLRKYLEENKLI
jgi:hypothetical protein